MKKCNGRCFGEEEIIPCPLRNNCKKFEEDVEPDDPLMFYTMAFGCDDYEEDGTDDLKLRERDLVRFLKKIYGV